MLRGDLRSPLTRALLALTLGCGAPPPPDVPPPPPDPFEVARDALLAELPPHRAPFVESALLDPSSTVRPALRAALTRALAGEDQVRVVVWGGSHVAGDLVTGPMRRALQRHFGDAGHGFVLPVPPYERYWQSGVAVDEGEGWAVLEPSFKRRIEDHYGPLASALEPLEPAFFAFRTDGAPASQLTLYYLAQPGGAPLALSIDGTELEVATDAAETAAGAITIGMADGAHSFEGHADAGPLRLFGAALERSAPGVIVDQLGLNGLTPTMLRLSDEGSSMALLRARAPDLLVLWLGGNESGEWWPADHHREQMEALFRRIRAALPSVPCLVLGALDRRQLDEGVWEVPPTLAEIFTLQRDGALAAGCAFYDSVAWEGGPGAIERLVNEEGLLRSDRVHLTEEGYRAYAADLLRALLGPEPAELTPAASRGR